MLHVNWLPETTQWQVEVLVLVTLGIHRRHILIAGDSLVFFWNGAGAELVILKVLRINLLYQMVCLHADPSSFYY